MSDWITDIIVNTYESFGLGVTFFAAMGFFFVVTGVIAFCEYRWRPGDAYRKYYEEENDVPFHKNYSTLADYLLLNPLVIVVIASVTAKMRRLPAMLAPMLGGEPTIASTIGDRYLKLLSPWWLLPLISVIACTGWFIYSHELAQKEKSKDKQGKGPLFKRLMARIIALCKIIKKELRTEWYTALSTFFRKGLFTEWYIVLATIVMMVMTATFLWRVAVLGWYLSSVTKPGLAQDLLLWSLGLGDIAEVISRLNLFFILLTAIVAVMALHDFHLHRETRSERKVRIWGFGIILLLTIVALMIPICTIHEHLVAVKSEWVRGLLSLRVISSGGERAGIDEMIRAVRNLPDWPVGTTGSVLTVVGQLIMLALPVYLELATRESGPLLLPKRQESTAFHRYLNLRRGKRGWDKRVL